METSLNNEAIFIYLSRNPSEAVFRPTERPSPVVFRPGPIEAVQPDGFEMAPE